MSNCLFSGEVREGTARNKQALAFTLIELMIYLALLAGLSLLVFGFAARTYRFMLERASAQQCFIRSVVTSDLVRRDLQIASPWLTDWGMPRNTFKQLTMTSDGKPIELWVGYNVDDKGLKRREGVYLPATGTWSECSISLVNPQVTKISLQPILDQRASAPRGAVAAVMVTMQIKRAEGEKEFVMTVALRNKVLL